MKVEASGVPPQYNANPTATSSPSEMSNNLALPNLSFNSSGASTDDAGIRF